jgi:hypothetical protein
VEMIKIDGLAVPKGEKRLVAACLGHDPSVSCPAGYARVFHWSTAEVMRTQNPGKLEFCVNEMGGSLASGGPAPRIQSAESQAAGGAPYACNTTYLAASDGFIIGSGRPYWGQWLGLYVGADQAKVSALDASTEMGVENGSQGSSCGGAEGSYVMSPVKQGDYWRVSCGNGCLWKVTFVPLR